MLSIFDAKANVFKVTRPNLRFINLLSDREGEGSWCLSVKEIRIVFGKEIDVILLLFVSLSN